MRSEPKIDSVQKLLHEVVSRIVEVSLPAFTSLGGRDST